MSIETPQAITHELGPDERLLWSGMPKQGMLLRPSDALAIPFSLMWGGFAFFWEYSVSTSPNPPLFMMLWGIPFMLAGIYMIAGRFFADSYLRSKTFYGISNERVIIVSGLFIREVKSLRLRGLSDVTLSERADHSGTIVFGSAPLGYGIWAGTPWPGTSKRIPPSFELIERARDVYRLIQSSQGAAA